MSSLDELEAEINPLGVRLIIIDAINSFACGNISTDSNARRSLSGPLQALARRTGCCIIGIRNWGRADGGTASQKALGATSLSDVARCVLNTDLLDPIDPSDKTEPPRFVLQFEKVSDAVKPEAIPFSVEDLSEGCSEKSHYRRIVWGKPLDAEAVIASLKEGIEKKAVVPFSGKKVPKKGTTRC
jgi:hypothetical protein